MVTALLMDEMADGSAFEVYQTNNDFNKKVPVKAVGSYYLGDGHEDGRVTEFVKSYTWCHAFSFGWIDLLDPEAKEKNPTLNTQWHTAQKGEYSDYTIVLTPTEYTLAPGHILKLYIFAQDPLRCRNDDSNLDGSICLHKTDPVYSFTIDNTSVEVLLPLRE